MRLGLSVLTLSAALLALAFLLSQPAGNVSADGPVTINLTAATGPDGGGSQTGTATLTTAGSQTEVVIAIESSPDGADVEQPAHIHSGNCDALPDSLGGVEYPLTNVVDGASTTTVDASLDDLQSGDFAINVHKSGEEIGVYVSCGSITAAEVAETAPVAAPASGGPPTASDGISTQAYLLIVAGALALLGGGSFAFARRRQR